ncbi:hypothetical protein WH47_02260 [Habropoda laboriosa]|uniref:Uncharacterized protein n=1 Tax=Habropoda laboriosa TaxID=597456 RepID=A0A0L7QZV7_9HYME|nr:hypothetical protein WH47_02260 [Habropoda laboriosa]
MATVRVERPCGGQMKNRLTSRRYEVGGEKQQRHTRRGKKRRGEEKKKEKNWKDIAWWCTDRGNSLEGDAKLSQIPKASENVHETARTKFTDVSAVNHASQKYIGLATIQSDVIFCIPAFTLGYMLTTKYGLTSSLISIIVANLVLTILGLCFATLSVKRPCSTIEQVLHYFGVHGTWLYGLDCKKGVFLLLTSPVEQGGATLAAVASNRRVKSDEIESAGGPGEETRLDGGGCGKREQAIKQLTRAGNQGVSGKPVFYSGSHRRNPPWALGCVYEKKS